MTWYNKTIMNILTTFAQGYYTYRDSYSNTSNGTGDDAAAAGLLVLFFLQAPVAAPPLHPRAAAPLRVDASPLPPDQDLLMK